MEKGKQIASHPVARQLAQSNVEWAKKLQTRGWSSLSTNQKRAAEAAVGYQTSVRVTVPTRVRVSNPPKKGSREGPGQAGKSMTIAREELLLTVVGTTGLVPKFQDWVINPRNVSAFPQMSLMAANFNKYKLVKFEVMYSPACSFETNGRVALGFNDDASDPVPNNRKAFYNLGKHAETAAQTPVVLTIPTDGKVRFMSDSANDDAKLVDFGRLILTTYGFDEEGLVVGELFLRYTIVLSDPTQTAKVSQMCINGSLTGPEYARPEKIGNVWQLKLLAAGSWFILLRGDVDGGWSKPSLDGGAITGSVDYTTEDGGYAVCVVEAHSENQAISTTLLSGTVVSWFVFRV
ncbi:CP [Adonis mosaic virus]|uniref:Capsid protein n=1 Tax=Adonis mosaic virus TaxID=1883104 RepID=A0A1J1DNU3_9TOMB|nr:CP [Adonis mosaic virus]BAV91506.1 CP [Adonis mosaic virus]